MISSEYIVLPGGAEVSVRQAVREDGPAIESLIDASIRILGGRFYDESLIESSLKYVFGVDTTMIDDGFYLVIESEGRVIGAGGWSHRKTPFGGNQATPVRDAELRQPGRDPAVIRAMYVHPDWAGKGVGRLIIETCEEVATSAGFTDLELVATLSGVAFYERMGYTQRDVIHYKMGDGLLIDFVQMEKRNPKP
jgi:GNAT superfamily N-acetyltransferase